MCKEGTEAKILRNPEHSLFLFLVESLKIFEDSKSFVIFMFFSFFFFFPVLGIEPRALYKLSKCPVTGLQLQPFY